MASVRTVQLGQFTDEHAERIAQRLATAGIEHWAKTSSGLTRVLFLGDWGTRLFVDADRLEEAQEIARGVVDP